MNTTCFFTFSLFSGKDVIKSHKQVNCQVKGDLLQTTVHIGRPLRISVFLQLENSNLNDMNG